MLRTRYSHVKEKQILLQPLCVRYSIKRSPEGVTRNFLGLRTFFKSTLETLLPNRTPAGDLIEFPFFGSEVIISSPHNNLCWS